MYVADVTIVHTSIPAHLIAVHKKINLEAYVLGNSKLRHMEF